MRDFATLLSSPFAGGERVAGFDVDRLLAPEQAIVAFFARARLAAPAVESVALDAAAGRILARDARAREDHPTHARSTMDGFAVASASTATRRPISGDVTMGEAAPHPLERDAAMRVPTGGALPDGADAVVPQEDVRIDGDAIVVTEPVIAGAYVTQRADDIVAGACVLSAGRRLGAPELGVLATLGIVAVPVFRRPRIGIMSTGDELVDPGAELVDGRIRDSNRFAVAASLAALGAEPVHLPRVRDDLDEVRTALAAGLAACDALVSTGGSSVGARDVLPAAVASLGAPGPLVHGLRVKPGKPTLLAAVGDKPVIALPGNPVSALMILEAVVRPIVAVLTGEAPRDPVTVHAVAAEPFAGRAGWTWFVPARLRASGGRLVAHPFAIRSAQTSLLARAAGYVTLSEQCAHVAAGDAVRVALFSAGGAPVEVA